MANTEVKIIAPKQILPDIRGMVGNASTWAQGDLLMFDTSAHVVRPLANEGEAASLLGIAQQDAASGVPVGPYGSLAGGANVKSIALNGPIYGNTYTMIVKTGNSIALGAAVFSSPADGPQVIAATGTVAIGVYVGHVAISSAAAGTKAEVLIGAQYPNTVLKF